MGLVSGSDFGKERHCPSSQDLASYSQRSSLPRKSYIARHLASCDFCSSELQLLSKVFTEDHPPSCPPMPASLRTLAEALLAGGKNQVDRLHWMFEGNGKIARQP